KKRRNGDTLFCQCLQYIFVTGYAQQWTEVFFACREPIGPQADVVTTFFRSSINIIEGIGRTAYYFFQSQRVPGADHGFIAKAQVYAVCVDDLGNGNRIINDTDSLVSTAKFYDGFT